MAEVIHVTDDTFQTEVVESDKPVLVDFWAEWCGPCRMIGPILEEMAAEHGDKIKFVKLNVDDNQKTPSGFGIMGIPTIILFEGGEQKKKIVGAVPKKKLEQELADWLS
jgi:thioredoxin 1